MLALDASVGAYSCKLWWRVGNTASICSRTLLACCCLHLTCFLLCRYNTSCYSSLLQQVDATADAEVVFQQHFGSAAVNAQYKAPYAALWLHPDDLLRLQQQQQQMAQLGSVPVRQSMRASFVASSSGGLRAAPSTTGARWAAGGLDGTGALSHCIPSHLWCDVFFHKVFLRGCGCV